MVLFIDLDGTLLDDRAAKKHYMPKLYHRFSRFIRFDQEIFYREWKEAIRRHHKRYTDGEISFEQQRRLRVRDAFGDPAISEALIDEVLATFDLYFKEGWRLFDDTLATLTALQRLRKGIISNGSIRQQNEKIDLLGLRPYFDSIVISEAVGAAKPDIRIFHTACETLRCEPAESLFIGDNWDLDVMGSHAAGMTPVWLNECHEPLPQPLDRLIVIEKLSDILGFLDHR